jgi:DNA-binding transcriptional regulator YhcF (GntR family)
VAASGGKRERRIGHKQIADDLREKIKRGELPPETKLPPQRTLAKEYGVATQTLSNALRLLRDEGVVRADSTTATYVTAVPNDPVTLEAVDERTVELAGDVHDLRERVGALEAQLMDLYSRTAQKYQPNSTGTAEPPRRHRKSS